MRQRHSFKRIGILEAEDLFRRQDLVTFDVRDAESFGRARVTGARHLSTANLTAVINETTKSAPILIYCYHGNASRGYAQILCDFGFSDVYSLDGGYEAWSNRRRTAGNGMMEVASSQWFAQYGFPPDDVNALIAKDTTPHGRGGNRRNAHRGRSAPRCQECRRQQCVVARQRRPPSGRHRHAHRRRHRYRQSKR
jgi:rhodanese-related sulfurtransferase